MLLPLFLKIELVFKVCLNLRSCWREERYMLLLWVVGDILLLFMVVLILRVGWLTRSSSIRSGNYWWLSDIISFAIDFDSEALLMRFLRASSCVSRIPLLKKSIL